LSLWITSNTRPHDQGNLLIYNNVLNESVSKSNRCNKVNAKVIPQQAMKLYKGAWIDTTNHC
jgi:hypothetical protein